MNNDFSNYVLKSLLESEDAIASKIDNSGSAAAQNIAAKHKDQIGIVSGDIVDAEMKHRLETLDKQQYQAILESKDIVKAYNDFIDLKIEDLKEKSNESGALKIVQTFSLAFNEFYQYANSSVTGKSIEQIKSGIKDGFTYQSEDPAFITKLLQMRLKYAETTERLLKEIIQNNAKILKLSSAQIDTLIKGSSSQNIKDMKDAIAKQKSEFIKNKYLADCRPIGAGVLICGEGFEIDGANTKFEDQIQDLCHYDVVVRAHGTSSEMTPRALDRQKKQIKEGLYQSKLLKLGKISKDEIDSTVEKIVDHLIKNQATLGVMGALQDLATEEEFAKNMKKKFILAFSVKWINKSIKNEQDHARWEFATPIKFVDGKTYTGVVKFVKACKDQGFKKIKMYQCNPNEYDLPESLKPGVVFTQRTNYIESTLIKDYEVADNPALSDVYKLEELALRLCEENGIDYTDDQYLTECMSYYENNKDILTEGKLATAFHKLVEFCGKIIGAIVGFIKMIVKGIGNLITKIANFLKNKDQRKVEKSVDVNSITLEAAKIKTTKVSSQDELYKVIESDLNKIAKEYKKVAEKQARINKELQNQLKQAANKEEANESSVINDGTNFTDRILNELYGEPEAQSVVVQEGLIKRIRELLSKKTRKQKTTSDIAKKGNGKKAPEGEKESSNPLLSMKTPYIRKEVSGKSYLNKFYKNNDFCIECASKDPKFPQILANILYLNYDINTPVEVYVISCEDINKFYDLAGDNAYNEDAIFIVIPFDTLKDSDDTPSAKVTLQSRWFNDVVDNNEYREYMAGRHEKSKQIQWIIDARGGRD